jgi:hypothetical protein
LLLAMVVYSLPQEYRDWPVMPVAPLMRRFFVQRCGVHHGLKD